MEIFTVYSKDAEQAETIRQFLETQQIYFNRNQDFFEFDSEKKAHINSRVQEAVASGLWENMTDNARQDYILGAIVEQADTTEALDAHTLKTKIRQRIHESTRLTAV